MTPTRVTLASGTSVKVSDGVDLRARLPLVAYLRPGNSAFLGDPVHITMLGAPETDFIMQEPPKHAYWDESKHAIVNFTRFEQCAVIQFQHRQFGDVEYGSRGLVHGRIDLGQRV